MADYLSLTELKAHITAATNQPTYTTSEDGNNDLDDF
jgi:hypothetical protein